MRKQYVWLLLVSLLIPVRAPSQVLKATVKIDGMI